MSASDKARANAILSQNLNEIGCRAKRIQLRSIQKKERNKVKKKSRTKRQKEREKLGDAAPPIAPARTIDNTRDKDDTVVEADDDEVEGDLAMDEFSAHFKQDVTPKIIITTGFHKPSKKVYSFVRELLTVFPNSYYYARKNYHIKDIVRVASDRGFTAILIINEDKKHKKALLGGMNAITHIHLPDGPTAHYKLSSLTLAKDISNHGRATSHKPEVILNNFNTRLGHRAGRMISSLFDQRSQFKGRQCATFHNQRDFIFFRRHRYVFSDDGKKATLQEIGPRFTLKLRSMQSGTFDTQFGEYEWMRQNDSGERKSRTKFFL